MNDLEIQLTEELHQRAAKVALRFDLAGVVADADTDSRPHHGSEERQPRRWLAVAASLLLVLAAGAAIAMQVSRSETISEPTSSDQGEGTGPTDTVPTRQIIVSGESMAPTLRDGATITVEMSVDAAHVPNRFDIIALSRLDGVALPMTLLKRVIALPGEYVAFENCHVVVNGVRLDEPYVDLTQQQSDGCGADQPEMLVPDGTVFVLGDNRGRSSDSRAFGPIPLSTVDGTMLPASPS